VIKTQRGGRALASGWLAGLCGDACFNTESWSAARISFAFDRCIGHQRHATIRARFLNLTLQLCDQLTRTMLICPQYLEAAVELKCWGFKMIWHMGIGNSQRDQCRKPYEKFGANRGAVEVHGSRFFKINIMWSIKWFTFGNLISNDPYVSLVCKLKMGTFYTEWPCWNGFLWSPQRT